MAAPLRKRAVGGGGGRGDAGNKRKSKKLKETKDAKKPSRRVRDEEIVSDEDDEWTGDGRNASVVEEEEGVDAQNVETADEKRLRLAQAFLERTRQSAAAEVRLLRYLSSPVCCT